MTPIDKAAPASIACGRSGLPLVAECPNGHRRTVPFRLLNTSEDDGTPIYGRRFKCRACGSPAATLFLVDSQAELDAIRRQQGEDEPRPAPTPTNNGLPDRDADLL